MSGTKDIVGLKIFINNCNSPLAYSFIEKMRNDFIEDDITKVHVFVGQLKRYGK